MPGLLYDKEETCPVCGTPFKVTKVRKSACPVLKRDTDFCTHYQNENPNLYDIFVCPACGYAAPDSSFSDLLEAQRKLLRDWLPQQPKLPDLTGQRSVATAITAYDRAIACAMAKHGKASQVAGLYLKAAWVYRVAGDAREAEYVANAATYYEQAFQTEQTPIGTMSDVMLRYLIGELLRRSGRLNEARLYFSHLVSDPATRSDQRIGNLARDQFQMVKEQLAAQGDAPEAPAGAPTPAVSAPARPTVPRESAPRFSEPQPRQRVTTAVPLYADQLDWARNVARANSDGGHLDTGAVLRAALTVAMGVDPAGIRAQSEEELATFLLKALRREQAAV